MHFRGPVPSKNVQKCSTVSKFRGFGPEAPCPIPDPKNVDVGVDFGTKNASKTDQNGGPKTTCKSIAFRSRFSSILGGFWTPRLPQKSSKIGQKSPKIGLLANLAQNPNFEGFREQIWAFLARSRNDFACFQDDFLTILGHFGTNFGMLLTQTFASRNLHDNRF